MVVEGVEREVWRVLLHKMGDQLAASLSFDLDRTTLLQAFSPYINFLQDGFSFFFENPLHSMRNELQAVD
jgi:hypothetical protein